MAGILILAIEFLTPIEKPKTFEACVAVSANDDVIVHINAEFARDVDDFTGHQHIFS